jgi:hypothetical protein
VTPFAEAIDVARAKYAAGQVDLAEAVDGVMAVARKEGLDITERAAAALVDVDADTPVSAEVEEGSVAWDDALRWLPTLKAGCARAVIYDPPYAVGTPVRGREDGAAGSVYGPLSFMSRTLRQVRRILMPGGICLIFADSRRMPDLAYIATTSGLRIATTVAWTRNRSGTGGLLRSAWDPILVVARGTPDAVDRAAIPNVINADYELPRKHRYAKPQKLLHGLLERVVREGDLVVDPFAGSRSSKRAAEALGARWIGCDIDPDWADVPPGMDPDRVDGDPELAVDVQGLLPFGQVA